MEREGGRERERREAAEKRREREGVLGAKTVPSCLRKNELKTIEMEMKR